MSDDIPFLVIFIVCVILFSMIFKKDEKIECYEDYMQKGIIATKCEKYFKDLDLGSDKSE